MNNEAITAQIESLMNAHNSTREEALEFILGRIISHTAHCQDVGIKNISTDIIECLVMGRAR